ncbi:hypothetical protein VOLCADRAFT_107869 [Volvox carteri f. nagariensis]|uniref:Uncharacterized protein n=1 Tax=Volvox carteri f. nagariensis TaxID=3068 RepID=D8UGY9_VOLCA|nr:uncharacterized protein VOLCADRAFT_107869 [Volvox carteri f. nagariensis]EFJ41035.1 hypothetical protein VOLCADRAFT_107869 [Volvox carteri f. nagariensis]|eukprot:XP_002957899.1 hypothetical protein VOLCADRAFT_107869 [Volvox carteri f. nagariensis]
MYTMKDTCLHTSYLQLKTLLTMTYVHALPTDALRFNSFGADEEEFEKYQSSQSHLENLQKSLGPLNNEDDKFVFIVEGKDSPVLLAGGVVFGSLENTDKVSIFILHRVNNSKKTSMVLPSGTIKIGKELKKHTVVELPLQSLLGRFSKQQEMDKEAAEVLYMPFWEHKELLDCHSAHLVIPTINNFLQQKLATVDKREGALGDAVPKV